MQVDPSYEIDIINSLKQIVGVEHVIYQQNELELKSRDTQLQTSTPFAIVYPKTKEEITLILNLIQNSQYTLWPCSRGKNWGYGSSQATQKNAILLNLSRMNQILYVDEDLGYAIIEPGVSYQQLNDYLKGKKSRLWTDCTDGPPEGSVIGNALERGIGETPYGDHFGNLCAIQAILADGSTYPAQEHNKTDHIYKWGVGPFVEGLFSQSNFGIVTRGSIWLMPKPECFRLFTFEMHDSADFVSFIDVVNELCMQNILQTKLHIINDIVSLGLVSDYPSFELKAGEKCLSKLSKRKLREQFGLAKWSFAGALYGHKERVKSDLKYVKKILKKYGRIQTFNKEKVWLIEKSQIYLKQKPKLTRLLLGKAPEVIELIPHTYRMLQGQPTEHFVRHAYFNPAKSKPNKNIDPARDRCGLIWFAPILPFKGAEIDNSLKEFKRKFVDYGFDFYVAMLVLNPRSVVSLIGIFYDLEDPEMSASAQELYSELCDLLKNWNYHQYRIGKSGWDGLRQGPMSTSQIYQKIKKSLDPNNIIAPGRYGI